MDFRHRLFFAVKPPAAALPYIAEEQRHFWPGRAILHDHLHLTTALVADQAAFPKAIRNVMVAIGDAIVARPFQIVLDQVATNGDAVVMCPSERLRAFWRFHRQLADLMRQAGLAPRPGWRFNPHMTLSYGFGRPFQIEILPLSWTVTEFVLIHSYLGRTRHEIVARWPLPDPADPPLH